MVAVQNLKGIAVASSTTKLFLSRLHVLQRNGEKMKTHYKSQRQKTTTYH
jgi:hypothetical protein